jgi:AraC family ethanolamine operon transcriptional activator
VRRSLLQSRKGETTVATIAFEHGFYELGRFAACYASQFGESPSATLSRANTLSIRSVLI